MPFTVPTMYLCVSSRIAWSATYGRLWLVEHTTWTYMAARDWGMTNDKRSPQGPANVALQGSGRHGGITQGLAVLDRSRDLAAFTLGQARLLRWSKRFGGS